MKAWVDEAYQLYIQGFSYPLIEDQIGVNKSTIRYHLKKYAFKHGLIYPRLDPNFKLAFDLYYNTMSVRDIARYMGVCESTIRNYIRRYREANGIPNNASSKGQVAYHLRRQGYTYAQISKMLGYENRSNCHRAIKRYRATIQYDTCSETPSNNDQEQTHLAQ